MTVLLMVRSYHDIGKNIFFLNVQFRFVSYAMIRQPSSIFTATDPRLCYTLQACYTWLLLLNNKFDLM